MDGWVICTCEYMIGGGVTNPGPAAPPPTRTWWLGGWAAAGVYPNMYMGWGEEEEEEEEEEGWGCVGWEGG